MKYSELSSLTWGQLASAKLPSHIRPLSVHIPLNLPLSDHILHCDCGFNAVYLPVPPDMKTHDEHSAQVEAAIHAKILSFAFGELPFVAPMRLTRWSRVPGVEPIIRGTLDAGNMTYILTYVVAPDTNELYIRVTVENHCHEPAKAVVRMRASDPLDQKYFPFHYHPYVWNDERWQETGAAVEPPEILEADGWYIEARGREEFQRAPHPLAVCPEHLLSCVDGCLMASRDLAPDESASFTVRHLFGFPAAGTARRFEEVTAAMKRWWQELNAPLTQADFGDADENTRFVVFRYCSLQLLLKLESAESGTVVQPCQGGSTERCHVWVWEAMCSLLPMLKLGVFKPVRDVIEFMFGLQDAGCPPVGEFTTTAGAIGTTGPRWANATGAALLLASEYLLMSNDEEFRRAYLPRMMRAAKWILGEVKATQTMNPDGTRRVGYGLMPPCRATDGDYGLFYIFTDNLSWAGVQRFIQVLQRYQPADAPAMQRANDEYRENFQAAVRSARREDGYIARFLGEAGMHETGYDDCTGAVNALNHDIIRPDAPVMASFIAYMERKLGDSPFWAYMGGNHAYIGNSEETMHATYLRLGQWKKAWRCAQTFREFGMTPDLFVSQERYALDNDSFTPWQPNASNNGRYLKLLVNRLFLEADGQITLLGSISPIDFLNARGRLRLEKLHTDHGVANLAVAQGRFSLSFEHDVPTGVCLRFPDHFRFTPDGGFAETTPGIWKAEEPFTAVTGKLALNS